MPADIILHLSFNIPHFNMPNTNSAKKALRQDLKRRKRNDEAKDAYKKAIKAAKKAIAAGEKDLTDLTKTVQKTLDKAAKIGVIKKNTAARRLSRIMKKAQAVTK